MLCKRAVGSFVSRFAVAHQNHPERPCCLPADILIWILHRCIQSFNRSMISLQPKRPRRLRLDLRILILQSGYQRLYGSLIAFQR